MQSYPDSTPRLRHCRHLWVLWAVARWICLDHNSLNDPCSWTSGGFPTDDTTFLGGTTLFIAAACIRWSIAPNAPKQRLSILALIIEHHLGDAIAGDHQRSPTKSRPRILPIRVSFLQEQLSFSNSFFLRKQLHSGKKVMAEYQSPTIPPFAATIAKPRASVLFVFVWILVGIAKPHGDFFIILILRLMAEISNQR